MCIICIKPAGVQAPATETIENMWHGNSDGAGIMYTSPDNNRVTIEKGFMHLKDLKKRLEEIGDVTERAVVYHFRITTHGGTSATNCHPFPVASRLAALQKTRLSADLGMAHNGIIDITPRKGISDTMEYDLSQLSHMKKIDPLFYKKKEWLALIEDAIDSKMVFLDPDGAYSTIGEFEESDGCLYSNKSYKTPLYTYKGRYSKLGSTYTSMTTAWDGGWDEYGDDCFTLKLMRLDDWSVFKSEGYKIIDAKDGKSVKLYIDDEFAISEHGSVFFYDIESDTFMHVPGRDAVDSAGNKIHFDNDLATYEYVAW